MSWERLNVGMGITHSAFSNGLCKRTSALFAKLLPSPRCVVLTNNYAYDLPQLMDLILAILGEA